MELKQFIRRRGLDLMIVAAAIVAVVDVLLRDDDLETAPVLAAVAAAVLVLPLLARHRSPFMAPVWLWLLAAALSFLDGRLVVTLGRHLRGRHDLRVPDRLAAQ